MPRASMHSQNRPSPASALMALCGEDSPARGTYGPGMRLRLAVIAVVAIATASTGTTYAMPDETALVSRPSGVLAGSAQSEGSEELGRRVARIGAKVRRLRRRLGLTRAALRAQAERIKRLERRPAPDEDGGLRSPNGRFAVSVSDTGIVLRAPSATLSVGAAAVTLTSGAGSTLAVGSARTTLASPVISLGGSSCPPVVRRSDPLLVDRETLQATFAASSLRVFAC